MGRPQQARSIATRARLLDATVACLYELGYSRTTTTVVCERAGVSRGAQLHHFPTKHELVVAAVDHVFLLRLAEFNERLRGVGEEQLAATALDVMWEMYQGASFYAWLELVVAARTDPELHEHVHAISQRFVDDAERVFGEMFPHRAPHPLLGELAPLFVMCVMDGMAVSHIVFGDGDGRARRILDLMKRVVLDHAAARDDDEAPRGER